jgi:hypothetical protein
MNRCHVRETLKYAVKLWFTYLKDNLPQKKRKQVFLMNQMTFTCLAIFGSTALRQRLAVPKRKNMNLLDSVIMGIGVH